MLHFGESFQLHLSRLRHNPPFNFIHNFDRELRFCSNHVLKHSDCSKSINLLLGRTRFRPLNPKCNPIWGWLRAQVKFR